MNRRELLSLIGAAAALRPFTARAQQKAMSLIGYLASASPSPAVAAFRLGLSDTGYAEGHSVAIEYRYAESQYDRLPELAADLVGRKVDLILASADPAALAAKTATATIPIVFVVGLDPVELGLVASLARPGGNRTGLTLFTAELQSKRLELLSELVPQARVIALLVNSINVLDAERQAPGLLDASRAKGMQLPILKATTEGEIDVAFASLDQLKPGALIVYSSPFFTGQREQLVALASHHGVPAIYAQREYVAAGGLIGYGPSLTDVYRQAGIYAGKILKGANPADLPVEQPTKFELVINLKTAKALGLTVPQSLLARADEIIE